MYTLRVVTEGSIRNHSLGNFYHTTNRFEHPERFREIFKEVYGRNHVADLDPESDDDTKNIIGFVTGNTDWTIPIDQRESSYVMTESGNTFERVNKAMKKQRVV